MSESLKEPIENRVHQLLSSAFAQSLAEALTRASGTAWEMHAVDALDVSPVRSELAYFRLKFEGVLGGDCFVELEKSEASMLAALAAKAAGGPQELDEEAKSAALMGFFQDAMKGFAGLLTPGRAPATIVVSVADAASAEAT